MGINSVKYQFVAGPIYIHVKKHKCIYCGEKVVPSFQTTVVNSFSPEAKNYDFTIGNTFFRVTVHSRQDASIVPDAGGIFLSER